MGDERWMAADWCGMLHLTLMRGSQGSVMYAAGPGCNSSSPYAPQLSWAQDYTNWSQQKNAETTPILIRHSVIAQRDCID